MGDTPLKISIDYDDNDEKMIKDFIEQSQRCSQKQGLQN